MGSALVKQSNNQSIDLPKDQINDQSKDSGKENNINQSQKINTENNENKNSIKLSSKENINNIDNISSKSKENNIEKTNEENNNNNNEENNNNNNNNNEEDGTRLNYQISKEDPINDNSNWTKSPYAVAWQRIFNILNIKKRHINKLYKIYKEIDYDKTNTINCTKFLMILDCERTLYTTRIFSMFDFNSNGNLDFGEFVSTVYYYCTLNKRALSDFVFDNFNQDKDDNLKEEEVLNLFQELYSKSIENNHNIQQTMLDLLELVKQNEKLDSELFYKFSLNHLLLLFPAFKLQVAMSNYILGLSYWEKLRNQYNKDILDERIREIKHHLSTFEKDSTHKYNEYLKKKRLENDLYGNMGDYDDGLIRNPEIFDKIYNKKTTLDINHNKVIEEDIHREYLHLLQEKLTSYHNHKNNIRVKKKDHFKNQPVNNFTNPSLNTSSSSPTFSNSNPVTQPTTITVYIDNKPIKVPYSRAFDELDRDKKENPQKALRFQVDT